MASSEDLLTPRGRPPFHGWGIYAVELVLVGVIYFALAKVGLTLASINPSASPVWPPTGLALAAILLLGYRVWPAILLGAFAANATILVGAANATMAGALATSLAIGAGNTIECLLGALLINRWSGGRATFDSAAGVARFALIAFLPTMLCATIGVTSLTLGGFADWATFRSVWLTWWLGDLAGALLITPVLVLWAAADFRALDRQKLLESVVILCVVCAIGLIAFSPIVQSMERRAPLGFLAVLPLLWSALRRGPRDTATAALILSGFAVWGTLAGSGPFDSGTLNESFLLLLTFLIGVTVPSLALSADVTMRRRTEEELRGIQAELNRRVDRRTAALTVSNTALQEEIDLRKRAENERDQQTMHLLEAQRLANLGSWVRDIERDTVAWSDQLYEIYGEERGQSIDTGFESFIDRVHPGDRERVRAEVRRSIRTGEPIRSERRVLRPSGEVRYLQTCVEMNKNAAGRVVSMHGTCLDITDQKEAELALERTREQLTQMQKMEALGQLTGGIAHDFNNLLMIVSGHAEMLRRKLSDPNQLRAIDAILGAGRRGESLTRQLLTFSRRQPVNPVPIDLRQRVQAMRSMLSSSLRGNITLAIDLPGDLWPVEADIAEFELALVNIAVNARDAMPDGGNFTVSGRNVPAGQGRGGQPTGEHVVISFSDTGEGIPQDTLKKIFDPFFTTKAVGKGTGLGLSQVYGFAHQSGGTVSVASEVGRGTTLTIYLPRSQQAAAVRADAGAPRTVGRAEGTILVVEDNPEVADVTATLIEQIGYRVLRAGDAHDALATIKRGGRIDLMFSDIVMPNGMNGIHLAQEVSEHYPAIRVLLTTGYSDVAAAGETRFPILRKPFELQELERALRDVMTGGEAAERRATRGAAR